MLTFDTEPTMISEIPFPALTICNMNKVRKSRVEYIEEQIANGGPDLDEWLEERHLVHEVCEARFEEEGHDDEGEADLDLTGNDLLKYLSRIVQPCDEMILR